MPTATSTLTGRERFTRALDGRDHDRVPRFESFWGDTLKRWAAEGLVGGRETVFDLLQCDMQHVRGAWLKPDLQGQAIAEDEQTHTYRTAWGAVERHWKHRNGTPEHVGFDCDSPQKWRDIYKPALLRARPDWDPQDLRRVHALGREKQRFVVLTGMESFENTRRLMGDELTMMAMVEDPDWVREVSQVCTDCMLRDLNAAFDLLGGDVDGVFMYGDMAYRNATMCSPAMYRELIWPDHVRLCDWAHQRGLKFIYHTDGDVNGVLDLYLEAGFDCLQPLEAKANMDVRKLAPQWGDRLALFGNIDVMVMATNDLAAIEQEIASKFAAAMPTKRYIYHSDHSVPPSVSWETYQHIIKLVDRYGWYT